MISTTVGLCLLLSPNSIASSASIDSYLQHTFTHTQKPTKMVTAIAVLKGDSKVRLPASVSGPSFRRAASASLCLGPHGTAGGHLACCSTGTQVHGTDDRLHISPSSLPLLVQVSGVVRFEQADENSPVKVSGDITGNDANAKRGFHVHQVRKSTPLEWPARCRVALAGCAYTHVGDSGRRTA